MKGGPINLLMLPYPKRYAFTTGFDGESFTVAS